MNEDENGNSAVGASNSQKVTGVPDPVGHRPGEPRLWSVLAVVW
jgi:hypothetical protein